MEVTDYNYQFLFKISIRVIQVRVRILGLDSVLVLYHGPLFISVPVLAVPFSLGVEARSTTVRIVDEAHC